MELDDFLKGSPHWKLVHHEGVEKLFAKYEIKTYETGLQFIQNLGVVAEANNHHPFIEFAYKSVSVYWFTHDCGQISELDFQLATLTDEVFQKL